MKAKIYGIKNCSTMKKAFDKLSELGLNYQFFDYKKQPISENQILTWVNQLGIDVFLNKKGMTWRSLTDEQKQFAQASTGNAIQLMAQNPSMIKRPIIEIDGGEEVQYLVGFDEAKYEKVVGKK